MEIKQVRYFWEMIQTGSFSQAAEKLSVSQSALSASIKKLEAELGVQLFYTFNCRQRLTDAGACLLADAKRLLDAYQEAVVNVSTLRCTAKGSFTLVLSPYFRLLCPSRKNGHEMRRKSGMHDHHSSNHFRQRKRIA